MEKIIRELKAELQAGRRCSKATLKDINLTVEAWRRDDWEQVKKSKLYNNHGGEYCYLLELIAAKKVKILNY